MPPDPRGVTWTKASRAKLHGTRDRRPGDPVAASPAEAWAQLVAIHRARAKTETTSADGRVFMPTVFQSELPAVAAALRTVMAELEGGEPPEALDPGRELLRAFVLWHELPPPARDEDMLDRWSGWEYARALIDFWAGHGGLASCLDVLNGPPQFTARMDFDDESMVVALEEPDEVAWRLDYGAEQPVDALWWALRGWLSQLPSATFEHERQAADAWIEANRDPSDETWNRRCRIAFAVSRDPSLAERLAAELRGSKVPEDGVIPPYGPPTRRSAVVWLYPSLADAGSVVELVTHVFRRQPIRAPGRLSFDLVDAYGADAAVVLETILASNKGTAKQYLSNEHAALQLALASKAATSAKPAAGAAKTAAAKEPAAKKAAAKKTAAKEPAAKKAAAKKAAAKKAAAKKPAAKKPAAKKPAAKKPAAKKPAAKKPAAKKKSRS